MAQILYIQGCAADTAQIASEQKYCDETVRALEDSGAQVTIIGNAREGFSYRELQAKLDPEKASTAIIVSAHGNNQDEAHFMRTSSTAYLWAHEFYKTIGDALNQQPANIFMFSCGSGNGLMSAQALLPPKSTIVNLVKPDWVASYDISVKSFSIAGGQSFNPAESLFLNMICKGLPNEWQCNPCLTTTAGRPDKGKIRELWELATNYCCEWYDGFPEDHIADARSFLHPHLKQEEMLSAVATMEYFSEQVTVEIPALLKRPDTPVRARYALDIEDFKGEVVKHGMLGHIGAIAYAIYREELGAFQRPITSSSREP